MVDREKKNAKIGSVRLGYDRGFFLCAWVHLKYDGGGQGFGGWVLAFKDQRETNVDLTGRWVTGVLNAVGAESWEDLPGMPCRVDASFGEVHGIGHFLKDEWFYPKRDIEPLTREANDVEGEEDG